MATPAKIELPFFVTNHTRTRATSTSLSFPRFSAGKDLTTKFNFQAAMCGFLSLSEFVGVSVVFHQVNEIKMHWKPKREVPGKPE